MHYLEARSGGRVRSYVAGGCQLFILPNKTSFEISSDILRITEPPSGLKAKKSRMVKENKGKRWFIASSVSPTVDFSPIHQWSPTFMAWRPGWGGGDGNRAA